MESIVLDLDDTIIPSSLLYLKALEDCRGIDLDRFERARTAIKEQIHYSSTQKHSRLLYFKNYLEEEEKFSAQALFSIYSEYEQNLIKHIKKWLSSNPDRIKTLVSLKNKGFKLYLATNETLAMQAAKLSAIDPEANIFNGLLSSEEAGFEKPASHFYEVLIRKFKLSPEKTFFVGDNISNDISAPANFNFHTIWVKEFLTKNEKIFEVKANYIINNLEGLLEIV